MSVTILEVLQNARHNLTNASHPFQTEMGKEQLLNAVILLKKDYGLEEIFDDIVEEYGNVHDAPEKSETKVLIEEIEYQVEQNPNGGRWTPVTYPCEKQEAEDIYQQEKKDHPDIQFRIVKIQTIQTVIK